jgi:hypothetical protein
MDLALKVVQDELDKRLRTDLDEPDRLASKPQYPKALNRGFKLAAEAIRAAEREWQAARGVPVEVVPVGWLVDGKSEESEHDPWAERYGDDE